jgi:hypothetical protein
MAPTLFRFDDIDAFRSSVRHLKVDFTPLARKISAEQMILRLPGCDVNYTKSFPRMIDAQLAPDSTAVGFSIDDGVPIRFNGVERDRCVVVVGSSGAAYSAVERTPRQYASIVFTPEVEDRGWPRAGANFGIYETSAAAQGRLRQLVLEVLGSPPAFRKPPKWPSPRRRSGKPCLPPSIRRSPTIQMRDGPHVRTRPLSSRSSGTSKLHYPATSHTPSIAAIWRGRSAFRSGPWMTRCNDIAE